MESYIKRMLHVSPRKGDVLLLTFRELEGEEWDRIRDSIAGFAQRNSINLILLNDKDFDSCRKMELKELIDLKEFIEELIQEVAAQKSLAVD